MTEGKHIDLLISEYSNLFQVKATKGNQNRNENNNIVRKLIKFGDWSPSAADELLTLVNNYGAFMLRNAFAIASVLEKEDGSLGF